jgi:hypothetical protein
LIELSPPYVYHVVRPIAVSSRGGSDASRYAHPAFLSRAFQPQHDEEALTAAIKQAMATPIERTILPRMRQAEVQERVRNFVDNVDWWRKWQASSGGSWGELVGQGPVEEAAEQ